MKKRSLWLWLAVVPLVVLLASCSGPNTRHITFGEAFSRGEADSTGRRPGYIFNSLAVFNPLKVAQAYKMVGDSLDAQMQRKEIHKGAVGTFFYKLAHFDDYTGHDRSLGALIVIPPLVGITLVAYLVWWLCTIFFRPYLPQPGSIATAEEREADRLAREKAAGGGEPQPEEGEQEEEEEEEEQEDEEE